MLLRRHPLLNLLEKVCASYEKCNVLCFWRLRLRRHPLLKCIRENMGNIRKYNVLCVRPVLLRRHPLLKCIRESMFNIRTILCIMPLYYRGPTNNHMRIVRDVLARAHTQTHTHTHTHRHENHADLVAMRLTSQLASSLHLPAQSSRSIILKIHLSSFGGTLTWPGY